MGPNRCGDGAGRARRGAVPALHFIPLADRPAWWDGISHVVARLLCLNHLNAVGPLMFRWTTVFREPGGPTEHKWSKQKSAAMSPLATPRPAPASPSYEY